MEIFKELNKKGYKHYYEGNVEELDSMAKDNQHLHSEIMQVVMWFYEKYGIWIWVSCRELESDTRKMIFIPNGRFIPNKTKNGFTIDPILYMSKESPIEAYQAAIKYCLEKLI